MLKSLVGCLGGVVAHKILETVQSPKSPFLFLFDFGWGWKWTWAFQLGLRTNLMDWG